MHEIPTPITLYPDVINEPLTPYNSSISKILRFINKECFITIYYITFLFIFSCCICVIIIFHDNCAICNASFSLLSSLVTGFLINRFVYNIVAS